MNDQHPASRPQIDPAAHRPAVRHRAASASSCPAATARSARRSPLAMARLGAEVTIAGPSREKAEALAARHRRSGRPGARDRARRARGRRHRPRRPRRRSRGWAGSTCWSIASASSASRRSWRSRRRRSTRSTRPTSSRRCSSAQAVARDQIARGQGRPADPSPVGALETGAARPGLLGLLRDEGRPGDAGQAARDGTRAARHHRQRRRADLHPVGPHPRPSRDRHSATSSLSATRSAVSATRWRSRARSSPSRLRPAAT